MIDRLGVLVTGNVYPYRNLAVEEYLTLHIRPGECVLFLWQNRRTVVIGRNQNCWRECRVSLLEGDGGYLVRRLSGGGAVFHDLGNLNFTFCTRRADQDVSRQTEVILRAVRSLGIQAERTGRNDLTAEGRKFSGSAYYRSGDCCYHHGTLLVDADRELMSRYLNVPAEKLRANGVESVRSRTVNLKSLRPDLTVESLRDALVCSLEQVYGLPAETLAESELDREEIAGGEARFAAWEWNHGARTALENELEHRFPWGGLDIQLRVESGTVAEARVYTDAMDGALAPAVERALIGCRYDGQSMAERLRRTGAGSEDIAEWISRAF